MTDAWPSIKIQEFEYVSAGSGAALVSVSGKPPRRRAGEHRPTLLVDDGHDVHRFAAIPGAPDPKGLLRASYSIPTVLIKASSKFTLEHHNGSVTPLPAPTQGVGRARLDPESRPAVAFTPRADNAATAPPGPTAEAEAESERRSDVLAKFSVQSEALAEAERAAAENDQTRRLAEAELVRSRQQISEQQVQIEALERKLADSSPDQQAVQRELAALRSSRSSLEHELDQSRDQLRVMTFERDELSRQAAAFDGVAVKARERAANAETANEQLKTTLGELEIWRGELERRLSAATSELGVAKAARAEQLAETLAQTLEPAQRLAELAGRDRQETPGPSTPENLESIRRTAEHTAREQAEAELQAARGGLRDG